VAKVMYYTPLFFVEILVMLGMQSTIMLHLATTLCENTANVVGVYAYPT
jgi:hypothetical protein